MLKYEDQTDHSAIKKAFTERAECTFSARRNDTAFWSEQAPAEWTKYPIADLPPDDIVRIMLHTTQDIRGALTRFELLLSRYKAAVWYRAHGADRVEVRFKW